MRAIVAVIAVPAVYVPLMLYLGTLPLPDPAILQPPFQHIGGNAWAARPMPGTVPDDPDNPSRSELQLYENGQSLGPRHIGHNQIAEFGHGRYSHWFRRGASIVFSTSDNSDPNTNGRVYRAVDPNARDPYDSIRTH